MAVKLNFRVMDGPQVDLVIDVDGPKCSIGGVGSGADREVLGLPHAFKYIEFAEKGSRWSVAEFKPRTTLVNEKPLKARNTLKTGDVIWLPSQVTGQSVRLKLTLEVIKNKSGSSGLSLSKMNPLILAGGAVYLIGFLGLVAYFASAPDVSNKRGAVQLNEVRAMLSADIESAAQTEGDGRATLSETPANFRELQSFLLSDIPEQRKLEMSEEFKKYVETQFSEAWRLEQQGRQNEARVKYQKVMDIMEIHTLETTKLALEQLDRLRNF